MSPEPLRTATEVARRRRRRSPCQCRRCQAMLRASTHRTPCPISCVTYRPKSRDRLRAPAIAPEPVARAANVAPEPTPGAVARRELGERAGAVARRELGERVGAVARRVWRAPGRTVPRAVHRARRARAGQADQAAHPRRHPGPRAGRVHQAHAGHLLQPLHHEQCLPEGALDRAAPLRPRRPTRRRDCRRAPPGRHRRTGASPCAGRRAPRRAATGTAARRDGRRRRAGPRCET